MKLKDYVIAALWGPPIITLWAAALGLLGLAYRAAVYGDIPPLPSGADATLMATGILGAITLVYYIVLTETFGEDTVENAQENLQNIEDEANEDNE